MSITSVRYIHIHIYIYANSGGIGFLVFGSRGPSWGSKISRRSRCPPHGQRPLFPYNYFISSRARTATRESVFGRIDERKRADIGTRSGPNDGGTAKRGGGGGGSSEDIEEMNGNGCRAKLRRDNYLLTALYVASSPP